MPPRYEVIGVEGIGEVRPGDDVARLVIDAAARQATPLRAGDVLVISQKIVSKAEGRLLRLTDVTPSAVASTMAAGLGRDPRLVEIILRESRRVVRMDRGVLVTETHHGWVCANAGVDQSNVDADTVALLPEDPDRSARRLGERFRAPRRGAEEPGALHRRIHRGRRGGDRRADALLLPDLDDARGDETVRDLGDLELAAAERARDGAQVAFPVMLVVGGVSASEITGRDGASGVVWALYFTSAAAGAFAIGRAMDRVGRRPGLIASYALLAVAGAGMAFFVSADNLMTLFLGLEWFSLCLYILVAIDSERETSLEAGLKYLVVGGFGSAVLLFGSALVYGATAELSFGAIGSADPTSDAFLFAGLAMILAGLAFKVSAAPFHMWTPDVYQGAPTSVTAFMAGATKVAALVMTLRILVTAFPEQAEIWSVAVAVLAVASLAIGMINAASMTY